MRILLTLSLLTLCVVTTTAGILHTAASNGDVVKCKTLLQPSLCRKCYGRSSYDCNKCQNGLVPGLSATLTDSNNVTPLHLAARYGYTDVCQLLIIKGAAVDAQDDDGETPLHEAVRGGDTKICCLILAQAYIEGQNFMKELLEVENADSHTALGLAKHDFPKHEEIIEIISRHTTNARRLVESDLASETQDDSGSPIIMIAGIVSAVLLLSAYAIYLLVGHLRKHRRPSPELATIIIE